MKRFEQLGAYGLVLKDNKILLIHKNGGPYDGKLDLPGGTIEFGERPIEALKREMQEEVGIEVINAELFDVDSALFEWFWKEELIKVHHTGVFYKVIDFNNEIKREMEINEINDDSLGAEFFEIEKLTKDNLSAIAIMGLKKLGYELKDSL